MRSISWLASMVCGLTAPHLRNTFYCLAGGAWYAARSDRGYSAREPPAQVARVVRERVGNDLGRGHWGCFGVADPDACLLFLRRVLTDVHSLVRQRPAESLVVPA